LKTAGEPTFGWRCDGAVKAAVLKCRLSAKRLEEEEEEEEE
jgi:hypothetical protein